MCDGMEMETDDLDRPCAVFFGIGRAIPPGGEILESITIQCLASSRCFRDLCTVPGCLQRVGTMEA